MDIPQILQYGFMQRAFAAGLVIAVIAPFIGNFLVVRRYSLMADTLAHVALTGVAVGLILQQQPVIVAVIVTVLAAIIIDRIRSDRKIFGESILAIFLSGSLAIAAILLSIGNGFNADLFSYLFGSIVTVSTVDLTVIVTLGAVVFITLVALYEQLFTISFDEELAQVNGLPVRAINTVLIILAAVTVALTMRIVGVLLIGALMVIPVVTAMQFRKGFRMTTVLSSLFGVLSVLIGMTFSFYANIASGGTIVVVALIFFFLSLSLRRN